MSDQEKQNDEWLNQEGNNIIAAILKHINPLTAETSTAVRTAVYDMRTAEIKMNAILVEICPSEKSFLGIDIAGIMSEFNRPDHVESLTCRPEKKNEGPVVRFSGIWDSELTVVIDIFLQPVKRILKS